MDGIINVYKEKGYTSHDVVAKLRGILHLKKIGHTGTLDPDAEGVLPVCLGTATRLCDLLTDKIKEYRVRICFGIATDTEDATGTILQEMPVSANEHDLRVCLSKFIGRQEQIPPMYSAIKVEGRKLYELAREGKDIPRKPRPITIYDITLHSVASDKENNVKEAELTVVCGKGTYIRSLCRDIGKALGTCACMQTLLRTKSGQFQISDSIRLSEIEAAKNAGTLQQYLLPVESLFMECALFCMKPQWDRLLWNGNPVLPHQCEIREKLPVVTSDFPEQWYRAYDSTGKFLALYERKGNKFVSVKMFLQ